MLFGLERPRPILDHVYDGVAARAKLSGGFSGGFSGGVSYEATAGACVQTVPATQGEV